MIKLSRKGKYKVSSTTVRDRMPAGAPRTVTPEKDELIELGKDLLEWANDRDQELRYHLNQWYTLKHGFTKKQYDQMCEKPEFQEYHKKARVAIASRYVDSSIHPSIAQRFLRLYFPDLVKSENDLLKLKSDLIKDENEKLANTTGLSEVAQALDDSEQALKASQLENKELKAALAKS